MPCGNRFHPVLAALLLVLPMQAVQTSETGAPDFATRFIPSLQKIAQDEAELQQALTKFPPAPVPHLTGRLGYHSGYSDSADTVEWVQLDLRRTEALDAVVIVPAGTDTGDAPTSGYGFPVRFRVELSKDGDGGSREVIADYTHEDYANPGALPIYLPTKGKQARYVRITATQLYREGDRYLFALGEVILLQGWRNLATRLVQEVGRNDFGKSRSMGAQPLWGIGNLVDGHCILGAAEGTEPSPTLGYQSGSISMSLQAEPPPRWVQVDLGEAQRVDEVRIFPAHPPEFAHRPGFGYPPVLKVEASNDPEFHQAVELIGFRGVNKPALQDHVNPGDNMMTFAADGEPARYIRVTAQRFFDSNGKFFFAFSELQTLVKGENVALKKSVTAFDTVEGEGWSKASIVDGYTSRANILNWTEWLAGLSERRETLHRIALLKQQRITVINQLQSMAWAGLAGLVLLGVIALFLQLMRLRKKRQQEMEALRQRISQDLHDEIGSSLGSIALISQDVIASGGDAAQVRSDLIEIQDIARETVDAMRDIVRLVQSDRYGQGHLVAHLRETADRSLRGVPYTLTVEAEEAFNRLPMDQQRDVMLMFKEVLHNIIRHAEATEVKITLAQQNGERLLTIQDNGRGFDPASASSDGMGLVNLRRRAAKIGGKITLTSAPASGTTLTITLPAP